MAPGLWIVPGVVLLLLHFVAGGHLSVEEGIERAGWGGREGKEFLGEETRIRFSFRRKRHGMEVSHRPTPPPARANNTEYQPTNQEAEAFRQNSPPADFDFLPSHSMCCLIHFLSIALNCLNNNYERQLHPRNKRRPSILTILFAINTRTAYSTVAQ